MASKESARGDWLTPRDRSGSQHERRRRSAREARRESLLRDWYGDAAAELEIESHQAPSVAVAKVVDSVLAELDMGDKLIIRTLLERWPQVVGVEIARHTSPRAVQAGAVLLVEVFNAVWLYRLQRERAELLRRVQEAVGPAVRAVRLVAGGRSGGPESA